MIALAKRPGSSGLGSIEPRSSSVTRTAGSSLWGLGGTASSSRGFELTDSQAEAALKVASFLKSDEKIFLFTGFAGTGKTTVLTAVLQAYVMSLPYGRVAFTAISNKAVKVMKRMVAKLGMSDRIDCLTCTKLLALVPKIDDNGKQIFITDKKSEPSVDQYKVVLVDECSMINEDMYGRLVSEVNMLWRTTKMIFSGDSAQLRPVNESTSVVFSMVPEANRAELTEVLRYDGAIGITAEAIRKSDDWGLKPIVHTGASADNTKGVFIVTEQEKFRALISRAFSADEYAEDGDRAKILCYTNAMVAEMNAFVHSVIYGAEAPRFMEGMRLIANTPVTEGRQVILPTSEECQINEVWLGETDGWKVWRLDVTADSGKRFTTNVLHESEEFRFSQVLDKYRKAKQWMTFWDYKMMFANLQYVYAITVHKSQGSTYKDAFILLDNLLKAKVEERKELGYVAFTRPSHRAFCFC